MTKYLIIADVSMQSYSTETLLFGIFSTKEEATQWIINNPIHEIDSSLCYAPFDFFENYEDEKQVEILERQPSVNGLRPRRTVVGMRTLSKEEYAEKYIKEFDGSPLCVGFYAE
jgi:hypothetical protein